LKIVDAQIPAATPSVTMEHPSLGDTGSQLTFAASSKDGNAVFSYQWDFGDGVTGEGGEVNHAYTEPGEYNVRLTATGLSGLSANEQFQLRISGRMPTTFTPQKIKRYESSR
jgi:PKD repeat protein